MCSSDMQSYIINKYVLKNNNKKNKVTSQSSEFANIASMLHDLSVPQSVHAEGKLDLVIAVMCHSEAHPPSPTSQTMTVPLGLGLEFSGECCLACPKPLV